MNPLLLEPIADDILKKMFLSDDLTNEFIKNKEYSTNKNVINVANVLLSYYMNMNQVDKLLSDYSAIIKNTISPREKKDITLRIQLLRYVQLQKKELDKIDNNKIINSVLKETETGKRVRRKGKKSIRKKRRRSY
jgi:hypothetical protein